MSLNSSKTSLDSADWDDRQKRLEASFLQTSSWARFQESIGHKPHFISGESWSCLLLERRARLGRYLFAPYGPTISHGAEPRAVFETLKSYARQQKANWLRLEPVFQDCPLSEQREALKRAGGRPVRSVEPHLTRIIDLTRPADDILASLSQTTRNIIRRNQRQNILSFKSSRRPADISILTDLLDTVASRKGIGFFTSDYYQKQAEVLMPAGRSVLEIAYYQDQAVGAALIHDFAKTASYTNAASLPQARDQNVSALLLWQAMLNAKERGNVSIDLYGIAPDDAGPDHPWAGFSSFKKKFGGEIVERAGTWDIPLSGKYRLYASAQAARKLVRGR